MSTLSQFFNSAASSGAGGVSYFGTSGTLTVPSDVTYIAYGAMGAGSSGCVNPACIISGGAGGGFSWWEGAVNCASPFNLTVTVGSAGANGGTSIVSGGPNTICATGGLSTGVGGIGYCGLINTCGGTGCYKCYNLSVCSPDAYGPGSYTTICNKSISAGGAGGLLGNGGPGSQGNPCVPATSDACAGGTQAGGGFGSGGGAGASGYILSSCSNVSPRGCGGYFFNSYYAKVAGASGGAGGQPGNVGCAGTGLNGDVGIPGYAVSFNLNGKLSQSKTFLSASGGGAPASCVSVNTSCTNWAYVSPVIQSAGAGGGGHGTISGGFGGGGGSGSAGGCGGGSGALCYFQTYRGDFAVTGVYGTCISYTQNSGGNGFVAVEYWK